MEAVQEEGIDNLASLEERITRAVQVITSLRSENGQLQQHLKSSEDALAAARAELEESHALSAEFQKENGELERRIAQLTQEMEQMRGERKQVKTRIEKLLDQLDLLSAS
jgi:chromosome segregation ATPase